MLRNVYKYSNMTGGKDMTKQEIYEQLKIPQTVLDEYKAWGLCDSVKAVMDDWQYDEKDLERLGMIMTLHDIGFDKDTIKDYMNLFIKGDYTSAKRLRILQQERAKTLDEIHFYTRKLERLDYLRHQMTKPMKKGE